VSKLGDNVYFCIIALGVHNWALAVGFVLGPMYILHNQDVSVHYSDVSQP